MLGFSGCCRIILLFLITPLSRSQGNHEGCPYGITRLECSGGHLGTSDGQLKDPALVPGPAGRCAAQVLKYYGRGLLSEMGRGKCQLLVLAGSFAFAV